MKETPEEQMEMIGELANFIDEFYNGDEEPKQIGFVLLVSEFGETDTRKVQFVSNADPLSMVGILKEWIVNIEAQLDNKDTVQ
jgi:hypothetical protein